MSGFEKIKGGVSSMMNGLLIIGDKKWARSPLLNVILY
jgi:hypothetical protein